MAAPAGYEREAGGAIDSTSGMHTAYKFCSCTSDIAVPKNSWSTVHFKMSDWVHVWAVLAVSMLLEDLTVAQGIRYGKTMR